MPAGVFGSLRASRGQLNECNSSPIRVLVVDDHPGHLGEILKTDVFLASLDLAYVRPVEPADVSELLLGPLLGRSKVMDPLAQKYQ
jgi:hypothetical protein